MSGSAIKKILFVDDNLFFLKLMQKAFLRSGFECSVAASAPEAIEMLKAKLNPDIILSDYEMPEMDGMEFRSYLLGNPLFKDIPFVFLTYFSDNDLMIKGLDLQAIDYVIKDTPLNVIISKVNNILSTLEKQRELTELEIKKAAISLNFKSIPSKRPEVPGFNIDFWHSAYNEIPGGDFIDFIVVNERYTFVILGDIMGKKWTAWFFTFGFLSYIRSAIRFAAFSEEYSTANILSKINKVICWDEGLKDILASLSLLLIDNETGIITYSGAGDLPLLRYKAAEDEIDSISSDGLLLGLFADGNFGEQEIKLNTNEMLFVFTDGMTDFSDDKGKKSDYELFSNMLCPFLSKGGSFNNLKEELFDKALSKPVDDRSIIGIYKN